jgi:hypothetical protein
LFATKKREGGGGGKRRGELHKSKETPNIDSYITHTKIFTSFTISNLNLRINNF